LIEFEDHLINSFVVEFFALNAVVHACIITEITPLPTDMDAENPHLVTFFSFL